MIHVGKRQKRMERSVNGCGYRIIPKRTQGVQINHLIFQLDAAVYPLQRQQLLHVESGEARALDDPEIAATSLHPENLRWLRIQGVGLIQLRACIASAEVRDSQVRSQQV